jgi:hypothetical protein
MAAAMGNLNIRRKPCDRAISCTRNHSRVDLDLNHTLYNVKPEATRFGCVTPPFPSTRIIIFIPLNRHIFPINREQITQSLSDDEFVTSSGLRTTSKIALKLPESKSVEVSRYISIYKEIMWNTADKFD